MFSRRRFLQLGAVAAGATLGLAQESPEHNCPPLPESITSLKSMKDQAKPITVAERRDRQEKARRLMRANGIDAILLMEGTSLNYFTGIRWWGGERTFALVLPAKEKPFFVCPAFEQGRAAEQIANSPQADDPDIRLWQEDDNPYQRIAQGLRDRQTSTGTLGVEETIRYVFSTGIAKASPQLKLTSATPVTAGCRMIKTSHEIALMRLASKVTLAAYQAAHQALREGMTQHDFSGLISAAHSQLGFPGEADVQVGQYTAMPHGSVESQSIQEGTIVWVDGGCKVEGYVSDISRSFVLGKATDEMNKVFDIVHRAQRAALKAARPEETCGSVDAAARKVISEAAYGPDYKYFTHRVGHGMGMDEHEWPYLVRGNTTRLAENLVFSDEPGIYIRGRFGVRLEDDMHITENGAELFTPQSPSLEDPFGKA
ncbi:MAG TPA: Xaa-Pro peptidase family protein [Terriglobales bacterium]|nr:Xaa-Pro peptidase family protein [Terriglobales bacterium]